MASKKFTVEVHRVGLDLSALVAWVEEQKSAVLWRYYNDVGPKREVRVVMSSKTLQELKQCNERLLGPFKKADSPTHPTICGCVVDLNDSLDFGVVLTTVEV